MVVVESFRVGDQCESEVIFVVVLVMGRFGYVGVNRFLSKVHIGICSFFLLGPGQCTLEVIRAYVIQEVL